MYTLSRPRQRARYLYLQMKKGEGSTNNAAKLKLLRCTASEWHVDRLYLKCVLCHRTRGDVTKTNLTSCCCGPFKQGWRSLSESVGVQSGWGPTAYRAHSIQGARKQLINLETERTTCMYFLNRILYTPV